MELYHHAANKSQIIFEQFLIFCYIMEFQQQFRVGSQCKFRYI